MYPAGVPCRDLLDCMVEADLLASLQMVPQAFAGCMAGRESATSKRL
jgi:hypothetical protein